MSLRSKILLGLLVLAVIALGCVVFVVGPRRYLAFRAWRATQFALQGEDLLRKNQIEEAVAAIRSGYALSPQTPEVLRAAAQLFTTYGSPEATNYWYWLLKTPNATDDDRRAAINCALDYGLYDKASTMIKDLLARNDKDSRNELLAARWNALRGTPAETIRHATRAVNDDPTNQAALFFLAVQEIANPYLHQDGIKSLFQLADSDDKSGIVALHYLSLDPKLSPAEINHLIARFHSHPLSGESERIAALELAIKYHPDQREALIDQAETAQQTASPDDLAIFADWLNNHNEARRVPKLISREKALSSKTLCFTYLDCLLKLKRWSDIKSFLGEATIPIDSSLVELYLSRTGSEMGDDRASDLHWQNAIAAALEPAQGLRLAMYAENNGQNERAATVYRSLTQDHSATIIALTAYQGLLRVSNDQDTSTLRDLLDTMDSRWPNDPKIDSQDIFLNLLLSERVSEMYKRAVNLLANDSQNLSLRTNVALACLRLNDPAGALHSYEDATINWNTAPVNDLVVYAAVLNANGRDRSARRLLFTVNRQALRLELRDLIKSIP